MPYRAAVHDSGPTFTGHLVLPNLIDFSGNTYDRLRAATKQLCKSLNLLSLQVFTASTIVPQNPAHCAIGIGITGLADLFARKKLAFDSNDAMVLSGTIMETVYHAALEASTELVKNNVVRCHLSYNSTKQAQGLFEYHYHGFCTGSTYLPAQLWTNLAGEIKVTGVANAEVTALTPAKHCASLTFLSEGVEPFES